MSEFSPTNLEVSSSASGVAEQATDKESKNGTSVYGQATSQLSKEVCTDLEVSTSESLAIQRDDFSKSNASILSSARPSTGPLLPKIGQDMTLGPTHALGSASAVTAGVKLACSWNRESAEAKASNSVGIPAVTGLHLMPRLKDMNQDDEDDFESFGEKDSYLSLLGEYSSLPMPTGSHFFSDISEVPSSTPLENPSPSLKDNPSDGSKMSANEKSERSPYRNSSQNEGDLSMFMSTGSTLYTNTLGQSCTLPSALRTVSSASTLQDVEDPWNTLIETPQPGGEVLHDTVRGTPVGQEDSESNPVSTIQTNHPTSATKTNQTIKSSPEQESARSSSENDMSSPEKRVRRNSYTLEHPSPALLDAQARNEAPHASLDGRVEQSSARRSLELSEDADTSSVESKEKEVTESGAQETDKNKELTEENLLHLQLGYFEEMRQHLEQQQRQQLQQLLSEQQQAQMALQREMAELEKHFQLKQGQFKGNGEEEGMGVTKELMQGMIGNGKEVVELAQPVMTSFSSSMKSGSPYPGQHSAHCPPSPDIPSKNTSPSVISQTSPIVKSTSTAGSGGAVEPFYLGRDHSRLIIGGTTSPVATRSPAAGEIISTPVTIRSPYNKIINSPTMIAKFDKVSAAVKGYLTRRIFKTIKVQATIKTIKDSVAFADKFISETPIKKGVMSMQDMVLAERVLAQVRAAQYDLYDIFFTLTASQRMDLITQSRKLEIEGGLKSRVPQELDVAPLRPLSAATVKALERKKKARAAEARLFGDKKTDAAAGAPFRGRPRSAAEGRVLKPLLSQVSPARPASTNTYRPSKYGIVIHHEPPKPKDPKKLTHEPTRSKVVSQRAPGNATQGFRSTKVRSPVTVKTKGVRRSLYPTANPSSKKPQRKTPDVRK